MMRSFKNVKALAAFGLSSLAFAAHAQSSEPLSVVASFSILGDMVRQVGGENIDLTVLVEAGADTHVYAPTPADARALSGADMLIVNGLDFEGWLPRLVEAANFDGTTVVATTGMATLAFEDGHSDEHGDEHHDDDHGDEHHDEDGEKHHDDDEHGHEEGEHHDEHDDEHGDEHKDEGEAGHDDHAHGAFDPHGWQSLVQAQVYVQNITDALVSADPANADAFMANSAAYIADIQALHAQVQSDLSTIPAEQRVVVTSHDAFGYFEDAYGVKFLAPQGLSTESEASAQDLSLIHI